MTLTLKGLAIVVVVVVSLVFGAFKVVTVNVPPADSGELTAEEKAPEISPVSKGQTAADQALAFIKDVAGVDVAKYNMTVRGPIMDYPPGYGGFETEEFQYTLESAESNFKAIARFVNGTFASCNFYFYEGYPIYTQTTPQVLDYAKRILERFQSVSGENYPVGMINMLDSFNPASPNTTLASSNMKFSGSLQGNNGSIRWVYVANGFEYAKKNVHMKFVNGHLEDFSNYWNVWIVGDAVPTVTREEAIEKAVERANSHELVFDEGVMPFTIATDKIDAQLWGIPREPLTLQLSWHVSMYFEKWVYSVYGLEVGLWADTGEIHTFGQLASAGLPPSPTPPSSPLPTTTPDQEPQQTEFVEIMPVVALIVIVFGAGVGLLVYLVRRK